jgi:hypothetical protein
MLCCVAASSGRLRLMPLGANGGFYPVLGLILDLLIG